MKIVCLLLIVFGFGIATGSWNKLPEQDQMKHVYQFDELEQQRADSNRPYLSFLNVDSMHLGVYSLPADGTDGQSPHDQDEIYYVQAGHAKIFIEGEDYDLGPGSIVFVPAYAEHRFHSISEDLKTLVFFSKVAVEKPEQ